MWRGNGNHHAVVGTANLQGQIIARDLVIDLLAAVGTAQGRLDERHGVVCQQGQAKRKQRGFGIAQRIDVTRPGCDDLKKGGLDAPPFAVDPGELRGGGPVGRYVREDGQCGITVAGRLRELDREATHPHHLPAVGVAHEQRLFRDGTAAARALARAPTDKLPLHLAALTHHEGGASAGHTEHQPQGAKVAIFDPEVIRLDVVEHLGNQAAFLGMAILVQQAIGDQHALLVQAHQGLASKGAAQVPRNAFRRCSVGAK